MKLTVKQLKHNNEVFVPQTTAEAVLVKDQSVVVPLTRVLEKKVEVVTAPEGSGLKVKQVSKTVEITHANDIQANETTQALMIQHDNHGHITSTVPLGKLSVVVDNKIQVETNRSEDQTIVFGDDFTVDNSNIKITWNNL